MAVSAQPFISRLIGYLYSHVSILVIIGIFILLAILFFVYKKFFAKKKKKKKKKKVFRINFYRKSLRAFVKKLPWSIRCSLNNCKYYIYLNTANDELVNTSTNISSYTYDYYSEYAKESRETNIDYKFHLSSNMFIHEMRRDLILNNNSENNKMFTKFCKKFFKYQTPTIIISIDYRYLVDREAFENIMKAVNVQQANNADLEATQIMNANDETIVSDATTIADASNLINNSFDSQTMHSDAEILQLAIRKKLILLQNSFKDKLKVYFTIANCDKTNSSFEDFTEYIIDNNYQFYQLHDYSEFEENRYKANKKMVKKQRHSDVVDDESTVEYNENLTENFEEVMNNLYQNISGLINKQNNPHSIISSINTVINVNTIKMNLNKWLNKISFDDGISQPPHIDGIFLSCYSESLSSFNLLYNRPFVTYRTRNIFFLILTLVAIGYFVDNGYFAYKELDSCYKKLSAIDSSYVPNVTGDMMISEQVAGTALRELDHTKTVLDSVFMNRIFCNDFTLLPLRKKVAQIILNHILLPNLKETNSAEKTLFYIFLIESSSSHDLRHYMLKNITKVSAELGISEKALRYFINYNNNHLVNFKGSTAYPTSSDSFFGEQYRYLINMYNNLSKNNNVTIYEVNNFLKYYFQYYNRKVTIDILLNKHFPKIKRDMPLGAKKFIEDYQFYVDTNTVKNVQHNNLLDSIDSFEEVSYSIPTNIGFIKLISSLNAIANEKFIDVENKIFSQAPEGEGQPYIVKRNWEQIVALAKINSLINSYFANNRATDNLFSRQFKQKFLPLTINGQRGDNSGYNTVVATNDNKTTTKNADDMPVRNSANNVTNIDNSTFIYKGSYVVDGFYTKLALDSAVIPLVNDYKRLINRLTALDVNTSQLEYAFNYNLNEYVKNYTKSYSDFINSLDFSINSETQLELFLYSYGSVQSPLMNLVSAIKANTDFEITDENKFMQSVVDKFKPMSDLIQPPKKGEVIPKGLPQYLAIINNAFFDIKSAEEKNKQKQQFDSITRKLSNSGRAALGIAVNDDNSLLSLTNKWLDSQKIPSDMREPFVKPILKIYQIGSDEITEYLNFIWKNNYMFNLDKIMNYFPFNQDNLENTITVPMLNKYLMPKDGEIDKIFATYFKPLLRKGEGLDADKWLNNNNSEVKPLVTEEMLNSFNHLTKLQKMFWDESGKLKSLEFKITPMLINEPTIDSDSIVKMTFLNYNDQTISGINAFAVWKKINVNWWDNSVSSAGVEMTDGKTFTTRKYLNEFSFYKLLSEAEYNSKDGAYYWEVIIDDDDEVSIVAVGFKIEPEPWEFFKLKK
ncbi:hypothetical protein AAEX28_14495 [Lentisphaerota bacterium WC36G]|nr:hypothetical protein LJT99_01250 [Lentisphaerae bacterium WC36]